MSALGDADGHDLRMVSRLAWKLTSECPDILGSELTEALALLRKEIEAEIGGHPLPQVAEKGVFKLVNGSNWDQRVLEHDSPLT
jgi:hypothetical protein